VVEDLDRLALEDVAGEGKIRHIRAPPGTIDGEKPQAGGRDAVEVTVGVGHQFVGFFRRGIETDGMVDVVISRKRHDGIAAVDRAGGGIKQVADRKVAAGLEDVEESSQVGVEIGIRVLNRIAHTGLGRKVDDIVGAQAAEQLVELVLVLKIDP